jgi:8-oxo-dGTP pyrophosphatase MutT (NUDIX family)
MGASVPAGAERAPRWRDGDARLEPCVGRQALARARDTIAAFAPLDERQRAERGRILAFVDSHPDALLRTCAAGHLTSSVLLLDASGARALLTLHAKLGRWLQLGGHCDGDGNLAGAALREAREESGMAGLAIDPFPIDLDVHVIPARPSEASHEHLDVRFLSFAPPGALGAAGAAPRATRESRELRWVGAAELAGLAVDDSLTRLYALAERRLARS